MAVALATKSKTKITEKISTAFIQKIYGISVSSILYFRNIFPEGAFDKCRDKDQEYRVLIADQNNPNAFYVYKMMQGCYDAIKKKYLKKVLMGFYEKDDIAENFLEYYIFQFSYDGQQMKLKLNEQKNILNIQMDQKVSKVNLLDSLQLLNSVLQKLPPNLFVSMRLFYDENTPFTYQPPGFIGIQEPENFARLFTFNLGHVKTKYHELYLKFYSKDEYIKQIDMQDNVSGTTSTTFVDYTSDEHSPNPSKYLDKITQKQEIKCFCAMTDFILNNMIQCLRCKKFQHAVCYGRLIVYQNMEHFCGCNVAESNKTYKDKFSRLALWRRVLDYCMKREYLVVNDYKGFFKFTNPMQAHQQIMKLLKNQVISKYQTRKQYIINGPKAKQCFEETLKH